MTDLAWTIRAASAASVTILWAQLECLAKAPVAHFTDGIGLFCKA